MQVCGHKREAHHHTDAARRRRRHKLERIYAEKQFRVLCAASIHDLCSTIGKFANKLIA